MAELGLRFRPTSAADLEAHRARLALLAEDMAEAPIALLDQAARRWAYRSRFMPTAAELVAMMQEQLDDERPATDAGRSLVDRCNARLAAAGRDDITWIEDGEDLRLVARTDRRSDAEPIAPADVARFNRALRKFGTPIRFDPEGRPYDLAPGEVDTPEEEAI